MSDTPAFRIWKLPFQGFLERFVMRNKIEKIYLYMGSSTPYFNITKNAILPLIQNGLIRHAIQFEVKNGGTSITPRAHGRLLKCHLENNQGVIPHNIEPTVL